MNRARASLLLPLLAIAACQTDRMPVRGFFTQPDGTLLLQGKATIRIVPIVTPDDGSEEKIYDYLEPQLSGWPASFPFQESIPPGTYVVELVDEAGQSWGKSDPLTVVEPGASLYPEAAAVIFVHLDAQAGTWTVDPTTQDSDPTTAEITMTNLTTGDIAVDRCLSAPSGGDRACTPVGTIAPGADLHTVETMTAMTTPDFTSSGTGSALVIHPAGSATPSYERPLVGMPS
jgi:hypothetical protein